MSTTALEQLRRIAQRPPIALEKCDELDETVNEVAALISKVGLLNLDDVSVRLATSILRNASILCETRNKLEAAFKSIDATMLNEFWKARSPHDRPQGPHGPNIPIEDTLDVETGSPFSTLRTWYLDHLDDPFPSATHLNTLESTLPINRTAILQCLTNLRRRSGYTHALRTVFDGNKYAMGECVKRVWNGTETDEAMKETIHKIMRYIDRSDKKEVGEWLQKLIPVATAEEDGHPINPAATKRPRLGHTPALSSASLSSAFSSPATMHAAIAPTSSPLTTSEQLVRPFQMRFPQPCRVVSSSSDASSVSDASMIAPSVARSVDSNIDPSLCASPQPAFVFGQQPRYVPFGNGFQHGAQQEFLFNLPPYEPMAQAIPPAQCFATHDSLGLQSAWNAANQHQPFVPSDPMSTKRKTKDYQTWPAVDESSQVAKAPRLSMSGAVSRY